MVLFDGYIVKYISEFFNKCNKCDKYDYYTNQNTCSICKIYFCTKCTKYKLNNGHNNFETLDLYCKNCVSEYYI